MANLSTERTQKALFTTNQLSEAFNLNPRTITKYLGDVAPAGKGNRGATAWHIADVGVLTDSRVKDVTPPIVDDKPIERDPERMTHKELVDLYKAEDLKQSAIFKELRNSQTARELIPAHEVELSFATAFKQLVLTLDTLADSLERDGIISSDDIGTVIGIIDSAREELANSLLVNNTRPVSEELKKLVGY